MFCSDAGGDGATEFIRRPGTDEMPSLPAADCHRDQIRQWPADLGHLWRSWHPIVRTCFAILKVSFSNLRAISAIPFQILKVLLIWTINVALPFIYSLRFNVHYVCPKRDQLSASVTAFGESHCDNITAKSSLMSWLLVRKESCHLCLKSFFSKFFSRKKYPPLTDVNKHWLIRTFVQHKTQVSIAHVCKVVLTLRKY